MRAFIAFTRKEFTESMRTYKLFIMLMVFVLFGIMSPVMAKMIPDLLKNASSDGIVITMPEPTALDSWGQFFKNVGQMGMLVLVIVFCGIMANEFSRGTLINMLTKGMKRHTIILSKFTASVLIWTVSYLLCLVITYAYTAYFWDMDKMDYAFLAFFSPWLYGLLLIALLIFGGVLFKTFYGSLLLCGGAVVTMSLLNINPKLHKFNPIALSGDTLSLLSAQKEVADFMPALIICSVLVVVFMAASVVVFNRKQI